MNLNKPLEFEISIPAAVELLPLMEISVAGALRDYGIPLRDGKEIARSLVHYLLPSLKQRGTGLKGAIHCKVTHNGSRISLKLWSKPKHSMKRLLGITERKDSWQRYIVDIELGKRADTFSMELMPPGRKTKR